MFELNYITEYKRNMGWQQPEEGKYISSELWETKEEVIDLIWYTIIGSFQYDYKVFRIEIEYYR